MKHKEVTCLEIERRDNAIVRERQTQMSGEKQKEKDDISYTMRDPSDSLPYSLVSPTTDETQRKQRSLEQLPDS